MDRFWVTIASRRPLGGFRGYVMRKALVLGSPFLAALAVAPLAYAASTYYVSPTGTATTGCSRADPCDLTSGVGLVAAGDTVILMDGVYKETPIDVKANGTSSAWITFQADDCATPILEGPGVGDTGTGVGSGSSLTLGQYVRYIGLVSRGWNTGFGNHWVATDATPPESAPSNGNIEYKYCIGDGNGRTGFTHFSASGIHIQNCISSHNGSNTAHSWSSGITLYSTSSSSGTALVEGNISFENMDAQKHTDGSGFIVDETSNNAKFLNNLAFRNGGSCFRLTKSSGTVFINNTCYHNAQDSQDTGPTNPGEVYFTDSTTKTGVSFMNNVFIATGTGPGANPVYGQPTSGWSNNVTGTGNVNHFTSPDGTNPDFTLASASTALIAKGGTGSNVPTSDIGFDPKCITKRAPTMVGSIAKGSWWQYSVDIDYIKSIGGVAKCFNPKNRSGTPDIGAYANGAVTKASVCQGAGGTPGTGGAPSTGGTASVATGGTGSLGGAATAGGSKAMGGSSSGVGGSAMAGGGTANNGSSASGGTATTGTGTNAAGGTKSTGGAATYTAMGGKSSTAPSTGASGGNAAVGGAATALGGTSATASTIVGMSGGAAGSTATTQAGTTNVGGSAATGGQGNLGGSHTGSAVTNGTEPGSSQNEGSCGCRVAGQASRSLPTTALGLLGLLCLRAARRRRLAQ